MVVPPENCRGNIVGPDRAQDKSMKQEGRGQGTTFERMTQPKGHKINWLKSNGSKMKCQIQLNLILNLSAKWHTQRCQDISSLVKFSHSVVSDSLQPHEPQYARPPCPSPTPGVNPNPGPLSRWCHPTISSCHPLLFLPPIPPSIRVFSNESTLLHEVAKVLEFQLQHQSYQWTPRTDLL